MVNRVLFSLAFAVLVALTYGWYYNNQRIIAAQQERIEKFMQVGTRYTAQDGQEEREKRQQTDQALCERVRALEAASYGYREAGKMPLACDYLNR